MKVESYFMDIMLKITNSFVCLNVFFPLTREGHWSQNMPWIVCQLLANFFHVSSNSTRSLSTRVSFWFPKWQIKLFIYFYFASLQIHCYIIKTMTKIERIKITMMRRPKRNYVAYSYINLIGLLRYNFTRYYMKTINKLLLYKDSNSAKNFGSQNKMNTWGIFWESQNNIHHY